MFLDKLKQKSAIKSLKKVLNASGQIRITGESSRINSLGCIVNFDEFNHTEVFKELSEELGLKTNAFKIIGYSSKELPNSNFSIPVFTEKDLGWNGKFKNRDIDEFLNNDFDLLINYYEKSTIILKLVSARTISSVKVGLLDKNQELNDITFRVSPNSFSKFKDELVKYLKILKKI